MFKQNLIDYVHRQFPQQQRQPHSISIEKCKDSIWDTTDISTEYIVEIHWESDDLGYDREFIGLENKDILRQSQRLVEELNKRVTIIEDDVNVESPTIKLLVDETTESPNNRSLESNFTSFRKVSKSQRSYSDETRQIARIVAEEIRRSFGDKQLKSESFSSLSLLFSDFHNCDLSSAKGYVETNNPEVYYSDVSSLNEFLEHSNQYSLEDKKRDQYKVFFRLDYHNGEIDASKIPDNIVKKSELVMNNRMSNYIEVNGRFESEAESILLEESGEELTTFWIRQDVQEILDD